MTIRLLRIAKLLHEYPALKTVVSSLLRACSYVGYVMLMMLIINFVFAVIAVIVFANNDPDHFGNMSKAMLSIWMVETLDDWEEIMCVAPPRRPIPPAIARRSDRARRAMAVHPLAFFTSAFRAARRTIEPHWGTARDRTPLGDDRTDRPPRPRRQGRLRARRRCAIRRS